MSNDGLACVTRHEALVGGKGLAEGAAASSDVSIVLNVKAAAVARTERVAATCVNTWGSVLLQSEIMVV